MIGAVLELQHRGDAERPLEIEPTVGQEIPQRVEDGNAAVELDPAEHVWAVPDDGIGTRIDDRMGPAAQLSSRLRAKRLRNLAGVQRRRCLRRRRER